MVRFPFAIFLLATRQFGSSTLVGRVAPLVLAGRIEAKRQIQTLNHLKIGILLPRGSLDAPSANCALGYSTTGDGSKLKVSGGKKNYSITDTQGPTTPGDLP